MGIMTDLHFPLPRGEYPSAPSLPRGDYPRHLNRPRLPMAGDVLRHNNFDIYVVVGGVDGGTAYVYARDDESKSRFPVPLGTLAQKYHVPLQMLLSDA